MGSVAVRAMRRLGSRALVLAIFLAATPLLLPETRAATGGPDAYGYVWVDNRAPSPVVPFSWRDITAAGTRVALAADDCTFEIAIGFQFRFYGISVDQIYVCANGFVMFSLQSFGNDTRIPDPAAPNDRIAALGMDLFPPTNGTAGVYILSQPATTPRRFIVTWNEVVTQYTSNRQTFQIVLEQNPTSPDGRILLQYQTLTNVLSPRIGIENRTGSSGLEYPNAPSDGLAVAFLPPSDAGLPPDTVTVTPTPLAPPSATQGERNVLMLQLDFATSSNEAFVSGVAVDLSGIHLGPSDVPYASLWLDDGDGTFSASSDTRVGLGAMQLVPARAMFTLVPSIPVTMANSPRVFLTYDIAPGARVGSWIGAQMALSAAVSVEFPDAVSSSGFPVETYVPGVRTRIVASVDTLSVVTIADRVPGSVMQWETDIAALSLQLAVGSNLVDLAGLVLEIGGNATPVDVWRVKVVEDVNGNGSYTPGVDTVLAVESPIGVPPVADLPFSRTIAAGAPLQLLLLFDAGPGAVVGNVANFTLNVTGVRLAPGGADVLSPANLPATTRNTTIEFGVRPILFPAWSAVPPAANGTWDFGEYVLGSANSDLLDPPAGNRVQGYVTVENNETMLFVAIDGTGDATSSPLDGVAIGFDTNRDGLPTNGSDDVYVANATGGARLLFNETTGSWVLNATCGPVGGNDTTPACAAGFGPTELSDTVHRFYEFAIPLAFLGIPTPVGAGTIVRFALASPPHDGLASEAGRSTWPILFDPFPSLRHFADLRLVAAPVPNQLPLLDWTGEVGYVADGLEPESGLRDEAFQWRVLYTDGDNDPPAYAQPRLHIVRDGAPILGSPFAMVEADLGDTVYSDGKVYVQTVRLHVCGGNFSYEITARDGIGGVAIPINHSGPVVGCPNLPPTLIFPQLAPPLGLIGTAFTYRIAYQDPEGLIAAYAETTIARDGVDQQTIPLLPTQDWVGTVGSYAQGRYYEGTTVLVLESANYTYRFRVSDGNTAVVAGPFLGPEVVPEPPDTLFVAGGDRAPLETDEGTQLLSFLQLILYTDDPQVNVTSIRVNRIGSAADTEVAEVLLYEDLDPLGLDPGDILLGSRPVLLGFATFPVQLRVIPTNASSLLVVANLTAPGTADATLGFEVPGATAVGVEPGDTVQPFSAIRSTRALVNVHPRVGTPTVDGFLGGSSQILHLLGNTPVFAWSFEDDNGADLFQTAYNVSVRPVSSSDLLWFRNVTTAATSVAYAGPALQAGEDYRVEVRVYDGRLWSAAVPTNFRRNTPPNAPRLLEPANLAADVPTDTVLSWEAVLDPDGDPIRYFWWVSESPGFSSAVSGITTSESIGVALSAGTEYFWKAGASDAYEFASGNSTVWRFTTTSPTPPILGEIQGRVMNGTTGRPLAGALVKLLNGTIFLGVDETGADGMFGFENLDLGRYTVEVRALGFVGRTLPAEPTETAPSFELGDIALTPIGGQGPGSGSDPVVVAFSWLPFTIAVIAAILAVSVIAALRRRSRRKETSFDENPSRESVASLPRPSQSPVREPTSLASPASSVVSAPVVFECPICNRLVSEDATRCACGAEFET